MKYKFYVVLFLISACAESLAQVGYVKNFGIEDGLPTTEIYDLEYDSKGQMWFTSDRGVSMYNGYEFKYYGAKEGLTDNTNFEIVKTNNGWLWFCAYNGTLSYYDGNSIRKSSINNDLKLRLKNNWIENIIDLRSDEYILIPHNKGLPKSISSSGSLKFDDTSPIIYNFCTGELDNIKKDTFEKFSENIDGLYYSKYYNLFYNSDHNVFAEKSSDASTTIITYRSMLTQANLQIINKDSTSKTFSIQHNVFEMDPVYDKILICSNKGLYEFEPDGTTLSNIIVKDKPVTKFLQDPYNNCWVSTQNSGVYLFYSLAFKEFIELPEDFDPVNLEVFNDQLVIAGKNGKGLMIFDENLN